MGKHILFYKLLKATDKYNLRTDGRNSVQHLKYLKE